MFKKIILLTIVSAFMVACATTIPPEKMAEYDNTLGKQYWNNNGSFRLCKELYNNESCFYERTSITIESLVNNNYLRDSSGHPLFAVKTDSGEIRYIEGREFIDASKSKYSLLPPDVTSENPEITRAREAAICRKKGNPKIGMTMKQVKETCLGSPNSMNNTTTASHVISQWVYDNNMYLYFTNGVLTSIQNREY